MLRQMLYAAALMIGIAYPAYGDLPPTPVAPMHPKIAQEILENRAVLSERLKPLVAAGLSRGTPAARRVVVRGRPQAIRDLAQQGFEVEFSSAKYQSATVLVESSTELARLSQIAGLEHIDLPEPRVVRAGAVTSRAPVALRAQTIGGGRADAQMVGIISDSFARTTDVRDADTTPAPGEAGTLQGSKPQDSGDLPPTVELAREGRLDGTDEGAAMAELVADIAPGAGLLFYTAGLSRASFADAIDEMCNQRKASIIVDDIGFLLEPFYQDGIVSRAAQRCVAAGIPFFSAAGNEGDQAYRQIYVDSDPGNDDKPDKSTGFTATGADLHDWGGGDQFLELTVPAGAMVFAVLQWNQPNADVNPVAGAQIDLDLYATRDDSTTALSSLSPAFYARSISAQGTTGAPLGNASEFVRLEASAVASTTFYLAVEHYQGSQAGIPQHTGTPLEFRLVLVGPVGSAEYAYNGPSMWGHPVAEGVMSVAAVPWWEAPDFGTAAFGTSGIDPEPYTSRGGNIAIQFDANGQFQNVSRFVPTIAGVDGTNTTFFGSDFRAGSTPGFGEPDGFPNFFGTSAAAPNVAGVAALLMEAFPGMTPRELADGLIASAIDVRGARAEPGTDAVSGAGLVNGEQAAAYFEANPPGRVTTSPSEPENTAVSAGGSGGGGGGGCFIATAAYGSEWSREVRLLREFRDRTLKSFALGRWFIEQYYEYSPALAQTIREQPYLKSAVRVALTPVVWAVQFPVMSLGAILLVGGALPWWRYRRHTASANR